MADMLEEALVQLGISYRPEMLGQLRRHVSEIQLFNPAYKLVADSSEDIWPRHVFDSLAAYGTIQKLAGGKRLEIADLGSGAGFPGVPLAIVLPEHHFTLVERMARRVGFLRNVLAGTGLYGSVGLLQADVKQVKEKFDLVVMRAFHPLVDIAAESMNLLNPGGSILAYKGTEEYLADELQALEHAYPEQFEAKTIDVKVPYLEGRRTLCLIKRKSIG